MSDSSFPNFTTSTLTPKHNVNEVWLSTILKQLIINGGRGTQQEFCFNKSFKRNCTGSTGIPNLVVQCKKGFNWTSGVGIRQKIRLRHRLLVFLESNS